MKRNLFKRGMAGLLSLVMCLTALVGLGTTTAFAAGEQAEVYLISFPRSGDANLDYGGSWGHPNLQYMNGWYSGNSKYTTIRAMHSYEGNICYCIEPGTAQETGDRYTSKDETFWDNLPADFNSTISPYEMKLFIGRIICSHAYHAIDRRVNNAALAVWKKLFPKQYNQMQVPLKTLCNLPHRHEGYESKTFAIPIEGKWFGITYAFITHSRHERKPFDQKMTPYTAEGRRRYVNYRNKHKLLPCDRPSINTPEDIALACYANGKGWKANFEYFMNREYAYNRDKGKCKCCGKPFSITVPKHCHHIDNQLPIERINKVPNLAWLCESCHRMVHNSPIPPELDAKVVRKIMKYREKLKP